MPDQIILLTGELEGPYLSRMLWSHNPDLQISHVQDVLQLEQCCLASTSSTDDTRRLVAFVVGIIVPGAVIDALPGPAYNFHPGPPNYPGTHPACFAIYNKATQFGSTVHVMEKTVDSGAIVDVEEFGITEDMRFTDLEALAYQTSLQQFSKFARHLAVSDDPLPTSPAKWSGKKTTQHDIDEMKKIVPDMTEEEILLRFRAFG